ncbi:hypothetical protein PMAYCL1PPCAC_02872 [Pristionchus mayeri]|uniref:Lin-2 n=1 Tax=Pristionchus mayeri TaxID=1317129 RepID=A0AAN4Z191_9BILA|nr:hypothetical protein PMAYCL1PPCAC_02872 [Pristionchus mayeri]
MIMRRVEDATASLHLSHNVKDVVQRGVFCTVRDAFDKKTGKSCTVKTIERATYERTIGIGRKELDEQLELQLSFKHDFIQEILGIISDEVEVHIIHEKLLASDICFEIASRTSNGFVYSEAVASHYFRQLLEALQYLHSNSIIHLDIRPHNILLVSEDNSAPLKLCGFDVASRLPSPDSTTQSGRVGVVQFMSPEMAREEEYGTATDMWSSGVLLHLILSGRLPFDGPADETLENIKQCPESIDLAGSSWTGLSDSARDLVSGLLAPSSSRFTASRALAHPWITKKDPRALRVHLQATVNRIRAYNERRKLKARILTSSSPPLWMASTSSPPLDEPPTIPSSPTSPPPSSFLPLSAPPPTTDSTHIDSSLINTHQQATQMILRSVDQISTICDSPPPGLHSAQNNALNDPKLSQLLLLYDKISSLDAQPAVSDIDGAAALKEVCSSLSSHSNLTEESSELLNLLQSPHLSATLAAHDIIVHEVLSSTPSDSSPPTHSNQNGHAGVQQVPIPLGAPRPFSYLNGTLPPSTSSPPPPPSSDALAGPSTSHLLLSDDDDLVDAVSRVRLVQFQKDTEEPMGITLKVTEEGRCFVARIMHGGMIHRQATLHVGDEIREINGVSVSNKCVESLQRLLRDARGQVTFKIVPSYRSAPPACEIFVRAQFDYEPSQDDLIPDARMGVPFKTGDILQIISKDDHNWWQARFVTQFPSLGQQQYQGPVVAGLIPSPELQEWRTACLAMERAKDQSHCMWFNKKKKYYTTKYLQKHSALFDQLDLVTYEEVMRLSQYRRKTLVLLGAHGVGRRHIKNTLIHRHPARFAYPIPHTTRPARKDEVDGKHYFFVSNDHMLTDIQNNEYLEYGTHEESMYGTKLETIRNIHRSGKIAILDVEPQALKVLRTAEYSPFVIFIAAPNLQGMQDPDGSLQRLLRESEVLRQAFGHLFDYVILNNDIDETISQIESIAEKLHTSPQWLPVSWVY